MEEVNYHIRMYWLRMYFSYVKLINDTIVDTLNLPSTIISALTKTVNEKDY